jgi:hypothetical protein
MDTQPIVFDMFSLSGDRLDRLRQALGVAVHQVRVAQDSGYGHHVEDALTEIEEAIGSHLARMEIAVEDDKADAEESGEAERERRSWFPRYRAA